ncbi:hypothetical protein HMP0015_0716 [Acinetobacter haemolyticus ATCC 19194]|uniref:Uncharacterized protein n=1 Tax=Acinetobacter haemolyticus ATCC 19194 TaxID=707232 RepID=D4XLX4_ACIHA|nr:hypothetical protein HMP0015_0716 [Acinetobacter haemolyticus ATCC 19194]
MNSIKIRLLITLNYQIMIIMLTNLSFFGKIIHAMSSLDNYCAKQ